MNRKGRIVVLLIVAVATVGIGLFLKSDRQASQDVAPGFRPTNSATGLVEEAAVGGFAPSESMSKGSPAPTAVPSGLPTAVPSELPTEVNQIGKLIERSVELNRRESAPDSQGQVQRIRLVRDESFKYPLIRVEDTYVRLPDGTERIIEAKAMVADHVMLRLADDITRQDLETINQRYGTSVRRHMPASGLYLVELPTADIDTVPNLLAAYGPEAETVRIVEPDYMVFLTATPADPQYADGSLWGLHNTGQAGGIVDADIDAPEAWELETGSLDVLVGVIDTGIDYEHEDLAANMWNNPGEMGIDGLAQNKQVNGVDDDGNGYIDDWKGWDFQNNDNDPMDDHFHGTHCAGTIGAIGDNGIDVVGVNWQVSLVGLKFLSAGGGSSSDAIEAIYYATGLGLDLTSNSWGGGGKSELMFDAIADAGANDILFVAASGNSNADTDDIPHYPSSYTNDNLISVLATGRNDRKADFSNSGADSVDLGAPGVGITSTFPNNSQGTISGTSMATPHVAGACALLKAYVPLMTADEIKQSILETADPLSLLTTNLCVTGGRLNIQTMLESVSFEALIKIDDIATDDTSGGNGDGLLNPGESIDLTLIAKNIGFTPATNVTLFISTTDTNVTLSTSNAVLGTFAARTDTSTNTFVFDISPACPTPRTATFTAIMTDDQSMAWTNTFDLNFYVSHTLSGITTLDGAAEPGVVINMGGPITGTTTSDVSGAFFFVVGEGDYALAAQYGSSVLGQSDPLFVTVPPNHTNLNFSFQTASISGTVTDGDTGLPVPDALVSYDGQVSGVMTTAVDGTYSYTEVYAKAATYEVGARKFEIYPYLGDSVFATVPPSTNIDFQFGPPHLGFDPESLNVTSGTNETPQRTITITNSGICSLTWSVRPLMGPGTTNTLGDVTGSIPRIGTKRKLMATDGDYLYVEDFPHADEIPPHDGMLRKYDADTLALLETWEKTDVLPPEIAGRTLEMFFGGQHLWFTDISVFWNGEERRYRYTFHAVEIGNTTIIRSVYVDPGVAGTPHGISFGDNAFWILSRHVDWNERTYVVYKVSATTGLILNSYPLPESTLPIVNVSPTMTWAGGYLWIAQYINITSPYYNPLETAKLFKLDPADGTILYSEDTPLKSVERICGNGNNLWLGFYKEPIYKMDMGLPDWMRVTPGGDSTAAGGSDTLTVTFDADKAGLGVHAGSVRIGSDDPDIPEVHIPVLYTVTNSISSNAAPVITNSLPASPFHTVETNAATLFSVQAFDPDTDPLAYTWRLDGTELAGETNASFSYAPAYGDDGSHGLAVIVSDDQGGVTQQVWQITVTNVNRAPVADPATHSPVNTDPFPFALTGTDPDDDALLFEVLTLPTHGELVGTAPDLVYTPDTNYVGPDSFTFRVNDLLTDSAAATVSFDVGFRDISVTNGPFTVSIPYGSTVTQSFTIANTGNRDLRWSAAMESLTIVHNAGTVLHHLDNLPDIYATGEEYPRHSAVAYDGTNLWVGNSEINDDDGTKFDLVKVDPETGAELQRFVDPFKINGFSRIGTEFAWADGLLWAVDTKWLNPFGVADFALAFDVNLGSIVTNSRVYFSISEYGYLAGIGGGEPDHLWFSSWATSYGAGGLHRTRSDGNGRISEVIDLPAEAGDKGTPLTFWNGAIWYYGRDDTAYLKLNPFTGDVIHSVPNFGDYTGSMAPDGKGGIWRDDSSSITPILDLIASGDYLFMHPSAGTFAGGDTSIDVVFATESAELGTNSAVIHVFSNDPDEPVIDIPVTFVVTSQPGNNLPQITNSLPATPVNVSVRDQMVFQVDVHDPDADPISCRWNLDGEVQFGVTGNTFIWVVHDTTNDQHTLSVRVHDGRGGTANHTWTIDVLDVAMSLSPSALPAEGAIFLPTRFAAGASGGDGNEGALAEYGGIFLTEAEHWHEAPISVRPDSIWMERVAQVSYGDRFMMTRADPSNPMEWEFGAEINYDIDVQTAGDYAVWMRVQADDNFLHNAGWVGMDGNQIGDVFDDVDDDFNVWKWRKHTSTVNLAEGLHTFMLRVHEDDYMVDRILLTIDPTLVPTNSGPLWASAQLPEYTYSWDFGDSSPVSDEADPLHTYTNAGPYQVTVTVTDEDAHSITNSFTYVVTSVVPSVTVDNLPVSSLTSTSATLNGKVLVTDDPSDEVYLCWGDEDGGTASTGDWDHVEYMGVNWTNDATFSTNVVLDPGLVYYYRSYIAGATEEDWADTAEVFTTANALPFTETFETNPPTMAGIIGSVDGQHGWSADPGAVVQNAEAWEFDQAAEITNAELNRSFEGGHSNVWAVFAWKPVPSVLNTSNVPTDATAVFWVNTNETFSAYSNQTPIDTGAAVDTSAWSRVLIHSDYVAKQWSLWLDGVKVIEDYGFYSDALSGFSWVKFTASHGKTLYLDDIRIGTNAWNPQPGDTDGDGVPDDWEVLYFQSPNLSDGSGDSDSDGLTDSGEEIAGTDPTDSNSVFEVSEEGMQIGDGFIIRWPSVGGRLYSVDSRTNLLTDVWSNIESNIAPTPPLNTYTVQTDNAETLFNRVRVRKQ